MHSRDPCCPSTITPSGALGAPFSPEGAGLSRVAHRSPLPNPSILGICQALESVKNTLSRGTTPAERGRGAGKGRGRGPRGRAGRVGQSERGGREGAVGGVRGRPHPGTAVRRPPASTAGAVRCAPAPRGTGQRPRTAPSRRGGKGGEEGVTAAGIKGPKRNLNSSLRRYVTRWKGNRLSPLLPNPLLCFPTPPTLNLPPQGMGLPAAGQVST